MGKHAFLLLSSPESPGKLANPLTYAAQLHDGGHEVEVYFDGDATTFFDGIADHAPPAVEAYEGARERGLVAGVCDHCATVKGVADAVEAEGFEIDGSDHAPDTAALVDDGFELHTVWDGTSDDAAHLGPEHTVSVMFLLTGVPSRSTVKYGEWGYLFTLIEADEVIHALQLPATHLGIGSRSYAGFRYDAADELLGLASDDSGWVLASLAPAHPG